MSHVKFTPAYSYYDVQYSDFSHINYTQPDYSDDDLGSGEEGEEKRTHP